MKFEVDEEQQSKLNIWLEGQYARVVRLQKGTDAERQHTMRDDGTIMPYFGVIGGPLSYAFTPTNLGTALVVHFCKGVPQYEAEIDLTEYDSW